ncbi:MAG: class I SAM-dependent methyltransferase [Vicingaceae bacterium]
MSKEYQTNFSSLYAGNQEYQSNRRKKAEKTLAVISDAISVEHKQCSVLEIGCFKGEIGLFLAPFFKEYTGLDIDQKAIDEAKGKILPSNLNFVLGNAEQLEFKDDSFDIVICSHVYEHVPSPEVMMSEIKRVMKKNGICYFAAGNRLKIIEPHYRLPFLSWLPKPMAHLYLKLSGKGSFYYESLQTIFGIKKLIRDFHASFYSLNIVSEPERFHSTDMIKPGSLKQKLVTVICRYFPIIFPTYIYILRKKQ